MTVKKIGFYTVRTGISEAGNELVVVSFLEDDNTIYSKGYVSSSRVKKHFDEIVESISYHHKNRYPWSHKTLNPRFYMALITGTEEGEKFKEVVFCYTGKGNEMLSGNQGKIVGSLFCKVTADHCTGISGTVKDGGVMCYKAMLKAFNLKKKKGSKLTAV